MSLLGGISPLSLIATAALGPVGGIVAQLAQQVLSQAGQQIIQQTGDMLNLPQSAIDVAQGAYAGSMGDLEGSAANFHEAVQSYGEEVNASPAEVGSFERDSADAIRYAAVQASESEEAKEAKAGGKGGSWLLAMARALGAAADRKADKLEAMSADLDKAKPSETAEFQAETQEFNMLMSAMTSTLKGIGEAMSTMAKRN